MNVLLIILIIVVALVVFGIGITGLINAMNKGVEKIGLDELAEDVAVKVGDGVGDVARDVVDVIP